MFSSHFFFWERTCKPVSSTVPTTAPVHGYRVLFHAASPSPAIITAIATLARLHSVSSFFFYPSLHNKNIITTCSCSHALLLFSHPYHPPTSLGLLPHARRTLAARPLPFSLQTRAPFSLPSTVPFQPTPEPLQHPSRRPKTVRRRHQAFRPRGDLEHPCSSRHWLWQEAVCNQEGDRPGSKCRRHGHRRRPVRSCGGPAPGGGRRH